MATPDFQLILASSSPYRKMMLARLHLPFLCHSPHIDETPMPNEAPASLAIRLSTEKALAVKHHYPKAIIIGSDQVATLNHSLIGKPGSFVNAQQQLRQLSGQQVQFHSALAVIYGDTILSDSIVTNCHFRHLCDKEINHYLHLEKPFDTAGSAKAEGLGISLMERISSDDPSAIIGLPLIRLAAMLRELGINPTLHARLCTP